MWEGGVALLRLQYLFPLAHVCHISAEESWDLTLTEFALYLKGIDEYTEALGRQGG